MDVDGKEYVNNLIATYIKEKLLVLTGGGDYKIGIESGNAEHFAAVLRRNIDPIVGCGMISLCDKIQATLKRISPPSASLARS